MGAVCVCVCEWIACKSHQPYGVVAFGGALVTVCSWSPPISVQLANNQDLIAEEMERKREREK